MLFGRGICHIALRLINCPLNHFYQHVRCLRATHQHRKQALKHKVHKGLLRKIGRKRSFAHTLICLHRRQKLAAHIGKIALHLFFRFAAPLAGKRDGMRRKKVWISACARAHARKQPRNARGKAIRRRILAPLSIPSSKHNQVFL